MVQIACSNLVHGASTASRGQLTAHIRGECKHVPQGLRRLHPPDTLGVQSANLFSSLSSSSSSSTRVETPRTRRNDGRRAMAIPSRLSLPNPYHECDASTSSPNDAKSVYRKLGWDFVGTYAQAARHFFACSRKEHDPLMADIRDLYAQYCAYRVQPYEDVVGASSVLDDGLHPDSTSSTLEGNDPTCRTSTR